MLNQHRVGMAVGTLFGSIHFVWSLLVALGLASSLVKTIMMLHFISEDVSVLPFRLDLAVLLVLVTSAIGYIVGSVFACLWNCAEQR